MDFLLSKEQTDLLRCAYDFGNEKILPISLQCESEENIPRGLLKEVGKRGFGAICVSQELGGLGGGYLTSSLVHEALAMSCPAIAAFISVHNMAIGIIAKYGTEEVKSKWLESLTTMNTISAYCLTEPTCGSDSAALKMRAIKDNNNYGLTGIKSFVTGGGYSDLYVVMARTGGRGPLGISALCVEKGTRGMSFGPKEKKMGWKSHSTSEVRLNNCSIPVTHLLGREGQGFRIAMEAINEGRLNIASCALGGAQASFNKAIAYMTERDVFGKKLKEYQALQFKAAEMETALQAARIMLRQAAWKLDAQSSDATKYCAMAKLLVTETSFKVANESLQLLGGYGYLTEYGMEKIVRDLRVHQIVEGSSEVMKSIISKSILS